MNVAASQIAVLDRIVPRQRIYTMRMQRHLTAAGLACVVYAVSRTAVDDFFGLMLLAAFVWVVLESLARALDARLGYWWGWLYGEPEHPTRFDLLVDGFLRRVIAVLGGHSSAARSAVDTADDEPRIRILPLDPP